MMKLHKLFKTKILFAITGATVMVVGFQNCSDLNLRGDVVYNESLSVLGNQLTAKYLSALLSSENLVYANKNNQGDTIRKSPILAKSFSVVLAVDKSATGNIFEMNSGSLTEAGIIYVSQGKVLAARYTTSTSYEALTIDIPTNNSNGMVIAATFGEKASDLTLMVNGALVTTTLAKAGTPLDFSYLMKNIATSASASLIGEAMAYSSPLSAAELNVLSRYIASNNNIPDVVVEPSLLNDQNNGGGGNISSPAFLAAKSIINGKCLSCHGTGSTYGVFANLTESSAISRGFVVPGSPTSSPIYNRLIGSSGSGTKDMPRSGSITAAEVQAIADWISGL
jgi:hypothetical protein